MSFCSLISGGDKFPRFNSLSISVASILGPIPGTIITPRVHLVVSPFLNVKTLPFGFSSMMVTSFDFLKNHSRVVYPLSALNLLAMGRRFFSTVSGFPLCRLRQYSRNLQLPLTHNKPLHTAQRGKPSETAINPPPWFELPPNLDFASLFSTLIPIFLAAGIFPRPLKRVCFTAVTSPGLGHRPVKPGRK